MKKLFKILIPLCLILVAVTGLAFSAVASNYTGSVDELTSLVEKAETASGADVDAALVDIADYLDANPISPSADGLDAAMERVYAICIARGNEYVDAIEAAQTAEEKDAALDAIAPLSALFNIPDGTEGYAECVAAYGTLAMERGQELAAAIDPARGNAQNGIAVRTLNAFIKRHIVLQLMGDEYTQLVADAESATAAHELAMADSFAELTADISVSDYEYGIVMDNDYSNAFDSKKLFGFTQRVSLDGSLNTVDVSSGLDGENSYLLFSYYAAAHSYIRTDLPKYDGGTVIEFDITTFDRLPQNGIEIASSSQTLDGERYYPGYATIYNDGTFASRTGQKLLPNAITVGEWTHISMVFHQATGLIDYYVDYEYLGSYDGTAGHQGVHNMHCFRIGSDNKNDKNEEGYDGSFAVDNFKIYQGTSLRQLDFVSSMSEEQRFVFYCDYLVGNDDDVVGLKIAYDYATSNIKDYVVNGTYTERFNALNDEVAAEVESAIEIYNSFDYEPIYTEYTKNNLEQLIEYADAIEDIGRGITTIAARASAYESYTSFLKAYETEIYKDDGRFDQTKARVNALVNQMSADENINTFIKFVDRFYLAFNAKAMESHYNTCTEMLKLLSANDIDLMNTNAAYAEFKEAYELYLGADEILAAAKLEKVSKQIIECIEFIKDYDTVEEWQANHSYINKYLVLIREFLREEDGSLKYDPAYEGVAEAIAIYEPINDYFFGLMQIEHAEIFEEQLARYAETDAYIEKMGICAYLRNYINENKYEIDSEDPDIADCIGRLEIYESELLKCKEDYRELLEYNTEAFAATVKKMQAADGYTEMKAYYEEAVLYYYAMNVGDSAIAEQLAAFDEASGVLREIEEASEALVLGLVEYAVAEDDDDRFVILTLCYKSSMLASADIDGVAEAQEELDEIYDAYISYITTANNEASVVFGAVAAQRANTEIASVAGVIAGIVTGR